MPTKSGPFSLGITIHGSGMADVIDDVVRVPHGSIFAILIDYNGTRKAEATVNLEGGNPGTFKDIGKFVLVQGLNYITSSATDTRLLRFAAESAVDSEKMGVVVGHPMNGCVTAVCREQDHCDTVEGGVHPLTIGEMIHAAPLIYRQQYRGKVTPLTLPDDMGAGGVVAVRDGTSSCSSWYKTAPAGLNNLGVPVTLTLRMGVPL